MLSVYPSVLKNGTHIPSTSFSGEQCTAVERHHRAIPSGGNQIPPICFFLWDKVRSGVLPGLFTVQNGIFSAGAEGRAVSLRFLCTNIESKSKRLPDTYTYTSKTQTPEKST